MASMDQLQVAEKPVTTLLPTATTEVKPQKPAFGTLDIFGKVAKVQWQDKASLPISRSSCIAVELNGSVYVGSGFEGKSAYDYQFCYRIDVYNLSTNQWSLSPITTPYRWFAMAVLNGKLIAAGGVTPDDDVTNKVLVLDDEKSWKDYRGKADVEGKVTTIPYTELLDTTDGCWYTCDNLPVPHYQLKAAVVNSSLYLVGGLTITNQASPQVFFASLETLSRHQLKWQSLVDTPWHCQTPVVLANKFLLVVGGRHSTDPTTQSGEVHALNPSNDSWELITNLPEAISGPAAVGVANNQLIVLGGTVGFKQRLYSSNVWIGTFE
ncbi:kelch-like protein 15 isoform X2 [Dysidea avara]|uniref:kelch-like protein 15 isoform X2 n=1 Tax=Dysidea avara TaxID=196820 RepID=UPI00331C450B